MRPTPSTGIRVGVYCGLVHHPVLDRTGSEVTTSVTNIDVHDIARSARTFGLKGYFVVHPIATQRPVVERIVEHWCSDKGRLRGPDRAEALALVQVVSSIGEALETVERKEGRPPRVWVTSAQPPAGVATTGLSDGAQQLRSESEPTLILFGTGHGLASRLLEEADAVLEPITGVDGYNHLSVRAAVAITLSRLFSGS